MTSPSCSPPRSPGPSGTIPAMTTPSSTACAKTPSQARLGRPILWPRGRHGDHGIAARDVAIGERHRGEPLALDANEGESHVEVLCDHLGFDAAAFEEADVDGLGAHHDVVDGEDEAGGVDNDAAAHALVAEDARGRVRLRDERVQVHHGAEQVACELDRDVHQGRPPRWRAKNSPTRRCASALAEASKPTVAPQQRPPAALWFSTSARNTRGCPSTSK